MLLNRTVKSVAAGAAASALMAAPVMADSCKMKVTFQNNHESKIKVRKVHSMHQTEDILPNNQVMAGERGATKRRRQLGSVRGNPGIFSGPGTESPLMVQYDVWEPENNRWAKTRSFFRRTCRPGKNLFFTLPQTNTDVMIFVPQNGLP